jgi:hypothetical protein
MLGATTTKVLYISNQASNPVTLSKSMSNINPTSLANYLTLNWDYTNQPLSAGATIKITLSLALSANTPAISNFSFDTIITGTG